MSEQTDDTTYRFNIRQGVKFSNGTELTPEIVKDSIQRSIDNNSRGGDLKIASIDVDFAACKRSSLCKCVVVLNRDDFIVHLCVEYIRNKSCANTLNLVRTRCALR